MAAIRAAELGAKVVVTERQGHSALPLIGFQLEGLKTLRSLR